MLAVATLTAVVGLLAGACSSGTNSAGNSPSPSVPAPATSTTPPASTPTRTSTPTQTSTPTRAYLAKPCSRLSVATLKPIVGDVQAQQSGDVCAYTRAATPVLAVTYIDVGSASATQGAEQALSNPTPVDAGPGAKAWSGKATGAPQALVVVKGSRFATVVLGSTVSASRYPALAKVVAAAL